MIRTLLVRYQKVERNSKELTYTFGLSMEEIHCLSIRKVIDETGGLRRQDSKLSIN